MNTQQRRILIKMVKARIDDKRTELINKREKEIEKLRQKNKKEALALAKEIEEIEAKKEELKEKLYKMGWDYGYGKDIIQAYNPYGRDVWTDKEVIMSEFKNEQKKIEQIERELEVEVWGIEGSFPEVFNDFEKKLAKI